MYRNPVRNVLGERKHIELNKQQKKAVDTIIADYDNGDYKTYLLHGVTGSGKTEVYLETIEHVLNHGRQAIVLIPEIALTFQTVQRFYHRFGDKVSIMNSRMSKGERYDQFLRAQRGDISVMIGPRSALPYCKGSRRFSDTWFCDSFNGKLLCGNEWTYTAYYT